jgi:hypothetical protein
MFKAKNERCLAVNWPIPLNDLLKQTVLQEALYYTNRQSNILCVFSSISYTGER